jgi:hypothetical protein
MASKRYALRRLRGFGSVVVCLYCLLGLPDAVRAENKCPWLNEATASGLLGGNAVGAFAESSPNQPAVCTFTMQSPEVTRTLRISMESVSNPHTRLMAAEQICGTNAEVLEAIGNEAVFCAADEQKGHMGERAVGRVRDQVFTILINSSIKNDSVLTRDALRNRIYTAAEQVAGNLF